MSAKLKIVIFSGILLVLLGVGGWYGFWLNNQIETHGAILVCLTEADRLIEQRKLTEATNTVQRAVKLLPILSASRLTDCEARAKATLAELESVADARNQHEIVSGMTDDELKVFSDNQSVPQRFQRKEERFTLLLASQLKASLPEEFRTREDTQRSLEKS